RVAEERDLVEIDAEARHGGEIIQEEPTQIDANRSLVGTSRCLCRKLSAANPSCASRRDYRYSQGRRVCCHFSVESDKRRANPLRYRDVQGVGGSEGEVEPTQKRLRCSDVRGHGLLPQRDPRRP